MQGGDGGGHGDGDDGWRGHSKTSVHGVLPAVHSTQHLAKHTHVITACQREK